jgi:hydroxymethylpyrimidine/phosphomethylpyrimidine kinase
MEDSGIDALRERLLQRADLLTPNRPEAETFTGVKIVTDDDAIEAGTRLLDMGARAVLMKGGHVEGKPVFVTDWLLEKGHEPVALRQPHVDTQNSHGTGCTLSAAIATQLGFGMPLRIAVTKAQEFLNLALRHSFAPGKGHGPVNHMASLKR